MHAQVSLFVVDRHLVAQRRVAPARVVPALDPGEDGGAGFGLGLEAVPVEQFSLQADDEAFCRGAASRAHRRAHTHRPAAFAKGDSGVPPSPAPVMDDFVGRALLDGHARYPVPVRTIRDEAALHPIRRRSPARIALGGHDKAAPAAAAADAEPEHQGCNTFGPDLHALIDQFGARPRRALVVVGFGLDRPHALGHDRIGQRPPARRAIARCVATAGRALQDAAEATNRILGPVCHHELEEGLDVFSALAANQAVAIDMKPRSILSWRFFQRRHVCCSRPAVVGPSLPGSGLPASCAACAISSGSVCAVHLRSRVSSSGVSPLRTASSNCWRNSAGYRGRRLGISGPRFPKIRCPRNRVNSSPTFLVSDAGAALSPAL